MPLRPRTHTIEDESERRFRDAIPPQWVVRRLEPDYGIDLTVEVFDDAGHSTPYSFNVQLKATDEEDVGRALRSVRFARALAEYYWSPPIPVLIVRYHAPTGQIYARWFHAYNPLVAAHPDADADAELPKTVGFVFSEQDRWTAGTPAELVHGVESLRRFRSPDLPLPLMFSVSNGEDLDNAELIPRLLALRRTLAGAADIIALRSGAPGPGRPHVVIRRRSSTVALADVASVTLDHDEGEPDLDFAAANLGCAVALLLATVGQPNLAAQVAATCASASTAITGMHTAFTLAGAFFRAGRVPEVLALVSDLLRRGDDDSRVAAFILQTAVLARGSHLTEHEGERAVEVARLALDTTLAGGDRSAAAGDAYNLGKALSRIGRWEAAAPAFEQAAELNPDYERRAYFHRDLAAARFESGSYGEAITAYERALAHGDDRWSLACLADSLMFAGRYADARARFAEYLADGGRPPDSMWRLKLRVLDDLRSLVGDNQDRRPAEAARLADSIDFDNPDLTDAHAFDFVYRALKADACCGAAHNRRMFLSLREDENGEPDFSDAVAPAIASAVLHRGDPGAWVNAIRIAAYENQPDDVLYDLMRTAVRITGQEVIDGVLAATTPPLRDERLAMLDQAAQDLADERHREGFTMRIAAPEGGVTEFVFSPPDQA